MKTIPTKKPAHFERWHRIKNELRSVGLTPYGLIKFNSRYLPEVIHDDEHIRGAVNGRYGNGPGFSGFFEGMLVATDKRLLFIDHKPGFTSVDELTYEIILGLKVNKVGPFSSITIHTNTGNYTLSYANPLCTRIFADYVEKRRLEAQEKSYFIRKNPN